MNKELEILDRLIGYDKLSRGVYTYNTGHVDGKTRTLEDVIKDIDFIKQALTPPTEEDICKALKCEYDKEHNMFYNEGEWGILVRDGKLDLDGLFLPPHIITWLGQFYENKETQNE